MCCTVREEEAKEDPQSTIRPLDVVLSENHPVKQYIRGWHALNHRLLKPIRNSRRIESGTYACLRNQKHKHKKKWMRSSLHVCTRTVASNTRMHSGGTKEAGKKSSRAKARPSSRCTRGTKRRQCWLQQTKLFKNRSASTSSQSSKATRCSSATGALPGSPRRSWLVCRVVGVDGRTV